MQNILKMYPKNTALQTVHCLESLVGVRTGCEAATLETEKEFWVEDIDGWDVQKLSKLAKASSLKGEALGTWIINSAAREMMGDLELMLNSGYSMKNMVGDMCSSCKFIPSYAQNTGVIVKTAVASNFQQIVINKLTILANVSGDKQFVIDDGIEPKFFTVTLIAGTSVPANLIYKTFEKSVKIYFTDASVPLGMIQCPTSSSCGCGKTSADATSPISITGLSGGIENATQYGFLVCAGIACSYDLMVCNMISKTPRIFGLAMLYKIGDKFLVTKNQSDRNNETASYNDEQDTELQRDYGAMYRANMNGAKGRKSIKSIVGDYLRTITWDKCIECQAKTYTAGVTG